MEEGKLSGTKRRRPGILPSQIANKQKRAEVHQKQQEQKKKDKKERRKQRDAVAKALGDAAPAKQVRQVVGESDVRSRESNTGAGLVGMRGRQAKGRGRRRQPMKAGSCRYQQPCQLKQSSRWRASCGCLAVGGVEAWRTIPPLRFRPYPRPSSFQGRKALVPA